MAFEIVSGRLLEQPAEAVVNRANIGLQYASGLCGEIFDAAGKIPLQRACCAIGSCGVGKSVVTEGFGLKAKYIIHAVPPRWCGGKAGEDGLLSKCYTSVLENAHKLRVRSVAFPLLSQGLCGYPDDRGLEVAKKTLSTSPIAEEMTVYLVLDNTKTV